MTQDDSRTPKDRHYARLRRAHRARSSPRADPAAPPPGRVHLYGLHTVREALANPRRRLHRLRLSRNAAQRLDIADPAALPFAAEIVEPKELDRLLGPDAVHQGVLLETEPLPPKPLASLGATALVLVLDQVTDPHNVGAILRSAVAFGVGALITTTRHSPRESGVLAKAASGALEHIELIEVQNLAAALQELQAAGFAAIGLDSEGDTPLENAPPAEKIALILGAEGKGLREKTRTTADLLARLDLPGPIRSLNVSNAAAVALHVAVRHLLRSPAV